MEIWISLSCMLFVFCFVIKKMIHIFKSHNWIGAVLVAEYFKFLYMCHKNYNLTTFKLLCSNMRLIVIW